MTRVRIFKPAKNAMQSGRARTKEWFMEFLPQTPRRIDPLMGWTASSDTRRQVRLEFDTMEEAVAHAEREAYQYIIEKPAEVTMKPKNYSDNFRYDRIVRWTH